MNYPTTRRGRPPCLPYPATYWANTGGRTLRIPRPWKLLIMHLLQKKAASRSRGASLLPILGRHNHLERVVAYPPGTNHEQGTDQITHHMAQEAVPPKAEGKMLRSCSIDKAFSMKQSADCPPSCGAAAITGTGRLKAGEVVTADKVRKAGANPVYGKRARGMGAVEAFVRGLDWAGKKVVTIGFALGRKAGVKIRGGFAGVQDADVLWQHGVESLGKGGGGHGHLGYKIHDHAQGVDSGIRAARPVDLHLGLGDDAQFFLKHTLNAGAVALPLPAAEMCAVIGDAKAEVALSHGSGKEGRTHQGAGFVKAVHQVHVLHCLT